MQKIIGICLGIVGLLNATPAAAQGRYMRNVVKNINQLNEEAKKGLKGSLNVFKKRFVTQIAPASRMAQAELWANTHLEESARAALSLPEMTGLFSEIKRLIPKEEVKEMLTSEEPTPYTYGIKGQDEFYLTGFPEQVLEENFIPSTVQLRQALSYYRTRFTRLKEEPVSLRKWGKSMALITDLGLFGNAQDAQAIVQAAGDFHGELAGMTDLIATRALINLGCYKEVGALAEMRLLEKTSDGKSIKLAAQWRDIKAYMDQADLKLDIDVERKVAEKSVALSDDMMRLLQQYNPYNLLQEDASAATTGFWLDLRQGIDAVMACSKTSQQLAENLNTFSSISQVFNKITLENLQKFVKANGRKPRVSYGKGPRDESTLASSVQNILNNYDATSPEVQAINQIYRDMELEKARQLEAIKAREEAILNNLKTPEQVLERLREFKNTYNRNPHIKRNLDLTTLAQPDLEEHLLATRVRYILDEANPNSPVVYNLKLLWKGIVLQPKPEPETPETPQQEEFFFDFAKLTRDLSNYIAENYHRPRLKFSRPERELSILEKEERKLHRRITAALKLGDPGEPGYQTLIELWESTPASTKPDSEQLIQRAEKFIEKNEGQWPRLEIYRDGKLIPSRKYTLKEAKEAELARLMSNVWKTRPPDDPFNVWLRKARRWGSYE